MPLFPSLPEDALVKDVYPMNPTLFRVWCEVEEGIMRGPSELSPGERELMGAFCSALNECTYCQSSHWEAAVDICFPDKHSRAPAAGMLLWKTYVNSRGSKR